MPTYLFSIFYISSVNYPTNEKITPIAQKLMFACDAEWSHNVALGSLKRLAHTPLAALWRQQLPLKPVTVAGIRFDNLLGLAAGLDKNAECIDAFGQMGFGFIEVGTVTPRPQTGNDKPRIFRLPQSEAIINRMGFNNKGVDYLVNNVKNARYKGVLGINIGKNKDTPNEQGKDDYIHCMRKVYAHASYITVNISSPNTPGLRDLQCLSHMVDGTFPVLEQSQDRPPLGFGNRVECVGSGCCSCHAANHMPIWAYVKTHFEKPAFASGNVGVSAGTWKVAASRRQPI